MTDLEVISQLKGKYGAGIKDIVPFPKPYMIDKGQVKAIYLGCDPSNRSNDTFEYAFALGGTNRRYNQFISSHQRDLNVVGLNWDDLYVQNLCRNYFQDETSKNLKLWKQAAREFWIERLYNELRIFPTSVPILLTSQYLLDVLALDGCEKLAPIDFYECRQSIPVPPDKNLLGRPLIPFYRGRNPRLKKWYKLSSGNWSEYCKSVKVILSSDFSIVII